MVGAVISLNGVVIGEGFHSQRGQPHAEMEALKSCPSSVRGATLTVTLEPCCHEGKGKLTPPCTEAIINAGISRVILGARDPNPRVAGGGIKRLTEAGIEVITGVGAKKCQHLNRAYNYHTTTGHPWVHLKMAQTLDGCAAFPAGGGAITGEVVQKEVHRLRGSHQAVLTGAGTVKTDDPLLDTRHSTVKRNDPLKIILNSALDLSPESRIFSPKGSAWLVGTGFHDQEKLKTWKDLGVETLIMPEDSQGRVDVPPLLSQLGDRKIISLLIEGGPRIARSLIEQGLVNELSLFVAPRFLGEGIHSFNNLPFSPMKEGFTLLSQNMVGSDMALHFIKREALPCSLD